MSPRFQHEFIPADARVATIFAQTNDQRTRFDAKVERVLRARGDRDKANRLPTQLCKFCFYFDSDGLHGQMFVNAACCFCKKHMTFATTLTDSACHECSEKYKTCRRCLADINLKKRRKKE